MAKLPETAEPPFQDRLILFRYFLSLFGKKSLSDLASRLNHSDYEGYTEENHTFFYTFLDRLLVLYPDQCSLSRDALRQYDENIVRYTKQIGEKRGGLTLKYFQYIALLFTEIYLDKYFSNPESFAAELNAFAKEKTAETLGTLAVSEFKFDTMNKLAFMCATGSGKTLIMHINILQFLHYQKKALHTGSRAGINNIILLAPNEGMSRQHLHELKLSSIPASLFMKEHSLSTQNKKTVLIIDMNKLKEEGKKKTVSVDSFEQNNLVLIDEAHRGLGGDVWYDYRTRLSQDGGFAFEYSATFKQALRTKSSDKKTWAILDEYSKSIIMDYSYKYFFQDGYGKDYRIYNIREIKGTEQKFLYLTGCLLSFYQQVKLFLTHGKDYIPFQIEKPLLVFVGNRVTAQTNKEELTDVEEILAFLDSFVRYREKTVRRLQIILDENSGLIDNSGHDLFFRDFDPLKSIVGCDSQSTPQSNSRKILMENSIDSESLYLDILRLLFHAEIISGEPRLHLENLRRIDGEIGLKIGEHGNYFGVINIGDSVALIKHCETKGIICKSEEFSESSLFSAINSKNSPINILIGSRKFTEGWNSWRVSTMGLINFAKGEGSQAVQMFGRGVRLHGYNGCLKRSGKLDQEVTIPKNIRPLETLTIFGIKAQYMEDFRHYLEVEDMPVEKTIFFNLPVISRADRLQGKNLCTIRLPKGVSFKKQAARLLLDFPDDLPFQNYLTKNKILLDYRSKVQTLESLKITQQKAEAEEYTLPKEVLPFLNYQRINDELELYKNEKMLYNISIKQNVLQKICSQSQFYSLIIPESQIRFDNMEKLPFLTDIAIAVCKAYLDKFYQYYRLKWESPRTAYLPLEPTDSNFVQEYLFSYTPAPDPPLTETELKDFIDELSGILNSERCINSYEKQSLRNAITAFDFRYHLYAPLLSVNSKNLKIAVSPISLNQGEKKFVDRLKEFCEKYPNPLVNTDIFLLRNKSKAGMGFFEASNFYPDYILWLDFPEKQYITFIDPKGLLHVSPDDPKVKFYSAVKELEKRLQPTSPNKTIILNSFIMSDTPAQELRHFWNMDKNKRESYHVITLDNPYCIQTMMNMILQ